MAIRKKIVKGHEYYYLEEAIRLEKPKVYSIFLGKRVPGKKQLAQARRELSGKIYRDLLGGAERIYLAGEQLIEAEKRRRRYVGKLRAVGKVARDEKDEIDAVNFVYTTLTTEGVPITKEDAELAYNFAGANIRNIRDENLRIALDMIKGLRRVRESKKGISQAFLLELHKLVMGEYGDKNPGEFRKKQAFIYLKSYEKAEEIRFRPPAPGEVGREIAELVEWYNLNFGKLNALELASLLHLRFYMIHPFADGNKRVSRLLLNKALFDCGYPILNVSKDAQGYFEALIKSVEGKNEKPFVEFVFKQFLHFM